MCLHVIKRLRLERSSDKDQRICRRSHHRADNVCVVIHPEGKVGQEMLVHWVT